MREIEIKFRGLTKDGKWVYGWYQYTHSFQSEEVHYIIDCCGVTLTALALATTLSDLPGYNEVLPETVGQFTGLKDKNGTEGFFNDRVKIPRFDGTFLIKWDGINAKYYLHNELIPRHRADIRYMVEEGEIIGKIHENPELLNEAIQS